MYNYYIYYYDILSTYYIITYCVKKSFVKLAVTCRSLYYYY